MTVSLLDFIRALLMFTVASVVFVEVIGYFWHRFAEHNGLFGKMVQYRHRIHHEQDYPADNLRPANAVRYKSSGSWTWYVLAAVSVGGMFLVAPLKDAVPMAIGSIFYAKYIVNYFHESFHLENRRLHRFHWFRRLTKLHDIHHWMPGNYGIVFFFMDRLFGTLVPEFPQPRIKKEIFPGRAPTK